MKQDLQEQVKRYIENRESKLLEDIIKLLQPFINKTATRIARLTRIDIADIKQELIIVIMKRLNSYNISKGKFLTYLINTCKGDPTDTFQSLVCKRRGGDGKSKFITTISIYDPNFNNGNDKSIGIADTISDKTDIRKEINYSLLKTMRSYMKEEEQKVYDLIYEDPDITDKELTDILSIDIDKIKQIKCGIKEIFIQKGVIL